jgi:hypothetical protein
MIQCDLKILKAQALSCANHNIQKNQYLNKFMNDWLANREASTEHKRSHKIKRRSSYQSLNIHPPETPRSIQRHRNQLEQCTTTQVDVLAVAEVNSYSFLLANKRLTIIEPFFLFYFFYSWEIYTQLRIVIE